jgi:hypothetical protein
VNAIVKNLGVAASDVHLGEMPARLRSKRTPLADYSIVYFVIHGLVADVKGLGAQPSKQPTEFEGLLTVSEVAQLQLNADVRLHTRGGPRAEFLIVRRSNFDQARQRRMVAQPRRQTNEKRCSKRLMQINRLLE